MIIRESPNAKGTRARHRYYQLSKSNFFSFALQKRCCLAATLSISRAFEFPKWKAKIGKTKRMPFAITLPHQKLLVEGKSEREKAVHAKK